MKLFGGLLNAICFQSFSTIHKQHLGLFSNFDHAKSGGKQGTLLTKVLMHLLCFKVIISRAFIPAVTMHVEPVCSEMCILQAEFFLIQIRPHLQQVMNHSKDGHMQSLIRCGCFRNSDSNKKKLVPWTGGCTRRLDCIQNDSQ